MKKSLFLLIIFSFLLVISGCGKANTSTEWNTEEMAGIENPGFNIVSKNQNSDSISFVLSDVDIDMVNQFIDDLMANQDFTMNINYNYNSNSYSYAAFNDAGESILFTYDTIDHSGYFIYALSGNSIFKPGVRDMGYSVRVNYDYMSNADGTMYNASLYYSIVLNVKLTSQNEYIESFELSNFKFKTESSLGSLSFRDSAYGEPLENMVVSGSSVYDMNFLVVQKNIGQYSTTTEYGDTAALFDAMAINQSELNFTITFTANVTTNVGNYTYDYEITLMPDGSDVTTMDRYMDVEHFIPTIDKGVSFIKIS